MPSTERARSPSSLVARVALGTGVSAAVVALLAAVASLLVAERLVLDAEDARLRAMAGVVSAELSSEATRQALEEAVVHEESELAPASIRIAVRDASGWVGGDRTLPSPSLGTCASRTTGDTTLRACAVQSGPFQIVASTSRARHGTTLLLVSCLVAAIVAAAGAAAFGRRSARWALAPLTRLRDSLDRIVVDEPRAVVVPGDDSCREVAAVRAALGALVARLADALDAAREFSADAAHELKTPLTVIRAELDLLAEEPLDAGARDAVQKLRARIESMAALVERLLSLATAADRTRLGMQAVAVEDVVRDVVARLAPPAGARIRLQVDAPGMVLGDEALLTALVENAVDNALKFSDGGAVEVGVCESEDGVVLDVRDHGPGIAATDRVRAFEPFFRTPASRGASKPGHGVGLALVARIAAAHEGTAAFIEVTPGERGARLRVVLPAWAPRAASPV